MTIKIVEDINLEDFEAWSGGAYTLQALTLDQCRELDAHLEELYPDGMSDTELNDFLWFEDDYIAELLGFEDWEALERHNKGEEDEEEEEEEEE